MAAMALKHQILDWNHFSRRVNYINYNPIKHGYVTCICDWLYSTFHRFVKKRTYTNNWVGIKADIETADYGEQIS